jgi:predicted dienelactone hydrolase
MFRGLLIATAALAPALAAAAPYPVGETGRLIRPAHARHWRGAATQGLITRIWYPAAAGAAPAAHDIGPPGHPLFQGHPVAIDAPVADAAARLPLLLLSHGTGGSADSLDWLGAGLAAAGYIVVAVNHPGNTALEPLTLEGFRLWWERATDLSDALDAVLADPVFSGHIDTARIGAVGFSLGGYTVLELAGAKTLPGAFEAFCASPAADAICHPPEMALVARGGVPAGPRAAEMADSLAHQGDAFRDPRVKAVFAIAPALGEAFGPASFADVHIPVALIGGDADTTVPPATNLRRFAAFLPAASLTLVPGAGHYTFVDPCGPRSEAPPFLCRDGAGVDREAVHALTLDRATAFFGQALR